MNEIQFVADPEPEIQSVNTCALCGKVVCVSLYLRVKPWLGGSREQKRAIPKEGHKYFGFWPPESHLRQYLEVEMSKHSLQRWYEDNCRGHTLEDVVTGIEELLPPIPGVPIRIMWNPATQVMAYMFAETTELRRQLKMDIATSVRAINVYAKADIRQSIVTMLNNTIGVQPLVSLPGAPVKRYEGPLSGLDTREEEGAVVEIAKATQANNNLLQKLFGKNPQEG